MRAELLETIIGREATLRILSRHAGRELYIPVAPNENMIDLTGCRHAAQKLSDIMARQVMCVPSAKRWRARALRDKGLTVSDIAMSLSMTTHGVRKALLL